MTLQKIADFDRKMLVSIQQHVGCERNDKLFRIITHLGDGGAVWILIGLILVWERPTRVLGGQLLLTLGVAAIIANLIIKPLVGRIRPCNTVWFPNAFLQPMGYSFPSGHAMSSFAAAMILSQLGGVIAPAALVLAILISFSRMYLQVHYPTDVAVGAAAGIAIAWFLMV